MEQTTIYIGTLPDDLPFELVLPDDAQVVGSIVRSDSNTYEIIADTQLEPDAVVDFFTDALPDTWERIEGPVMSPGGFVEREFTGGLFCSDDASLNVNVSTTDGEMSDLRLYIVSPADPYMCEGGAEMAMRDPFMMLPRLETPEGVELLPGSGGGSGGGFPGRRSATSTANLATELPLDELAAAYNSQLEAAGWEQTDSAVSGGVAWSGWTFTDDEGALWGGTFTLTANPTNEGEYTAWLMIQEAGEE